ncbi:hypothetical protein [Planctomycetes bacterium Poly30]
MRSVSPLALAVGLASASFADVRLSASGTVDILSGTLTGAYSSVALGDTGEVSLLISDIGVQGSAPTSLVYDILPAGSTFTVNGTNPTTVASGTLEIFPGNGAVGVINCECTLATGEGFTLALIDKGLSGQGVIDTNVLTDLPGTISTADLTNWAYQVTTGGGALFSMLSLPGVSIADADLLGTTYCIGSPNSTGLPGVLQVDGSATAADNQVELTAIDLPMGQFGYFLNSPNQGFVATPGGSQGNLCLGASIGRYAQNVVNTGTLGAATLQLDLANTPTPGGGTAILAGQTWHFQFWHRDFGAVPTSNFTSAVRVEFE